MHTHTPLPHHHDYFQQEIMDNRQEINELKQQIGRLQVLIQDQADNQARTLREEGTRNDVLKKEITDLVHDEVLKTSMRD
jgi:pimeloyl-CoA synthetase